MRNEVVQSLYQLLLERKEHFTEGSYTCYLFEKGIDKILKKCGEECSEVIIAAKSLEAALKTPAGAAGAPEPETPPGSPEAKEGEAVRAPAGLKERSELENEICDLIYHLMTLMALLEIPPEDIGEILVERSKKTGNLKPPRLRGLN
jgi:phosphoribosyl-ATP pyrophosphohydrolase